MGHDGNYIHFRNDTDGNYYAYAEAGLASYHTMCKHNGGTGTPYQPKDQLATYAITFRTSDTKAIIAGPKNCSCESESKLAVLSGGDGYNITTSSF